MPLQIYVYPLICTLLSLANMCAEMILLHGRSVAALDVSNTRKYANNSTTPFPVPPFSLKIETEHFMLAGLCHGNKLGTEHH